MRIEAIAWFDMPNNGKWHGQSVMPQQELIRCKYCKYNPEKRRGCPMAECPTRNDDSFCSWAVMGEMKEE